MAHWAEIDENNIVLSVTVGDNNDPAGDEGYSWLVENIGGRWLKTSYNANFRKNYAGIGYFYDEELDAFIPPQPFPSWVLDTEACLWQAPVPMPDDAVYFWNEAELAWQVMDLSDAPAE